MAARSLKNLQVVGISQKTDFYITAKELSRGDKIRGYQHRLQYLLLRRDSVFLRTCETSPLRLNLPLIFPWGCCQYKTGWHRELGD